MSVYERTVDTEAESVAFAQTEKHIYGSSRLGMHDQPVAMLGSQNDTYVMDTVNHRIGHRLYELSNHLGNVLSVVSDKLMPSAEEYETVVDFDDRFDTDGDFLGWDGYHWATDTTFVDNGAQAFVGYGYALKYWPLITDVIPYYNGNWVTNYTFTCDIVYMNPGGSVTIGTDGSAYQTFYSSGPQTWNFSYNPYFGAGMEITANGDSIVLDNIKLIHDVPPYQYRVADIRQSTDYSPFGVTLENRNLTLTGAEKSRYAFNGMEKDDEVKGEGNSYDFGARMYDSRLGRWLSMDAYANKYPNISPYVFAANMPIRVLDPDGNHLIFTSDDPCNFVAIQAIINKGFGKNIVTIDDHGKLTLNKTNFIQRMFFNKSQKAMYKFLKAATDPEKTTTVGLVRNEDFPVASYKYEKIDVDDVERIGDGAASNSYATLGHELKEQYWKQTQLPEKIKELKEGYDIAHEREATKFEEELTGYKRAKLTEKESEDNQNKEGVTGHYDIKFTKQGKVKKGESKVIFVITNIENGNITSVERLNTKQYRERNKSQEKTKTN